MKKTNIYSLKQINKNVLDKGYSLDGKITIRLFEYDAQIALDEGEVIKETLTVTFPNTAVYIFGLTKKH